MLQVPNIILFLRHFFNPLIDNTSFSSLSTTVPFGTVVTALVATFTHNGTDVRITGTLQTSGTTANNFTAPVVYTVTASDASTQNYTVTVTVLPTPGKAYYGTLTSRAQRYGNAQTLTASSTQIFDPADTFKLATVLDTQRDIFYIGMGAAGNYSIHVYDNASTNANVLSRTITITTMHRVAGLALDMANDRLYAINLDITTGPSTNRFIFKINNASTRNGTLVAGADYSQITSTALHSGNQGLRRMTLDTQRDILYICHFANNAVLAYDGVSTYAHGATHEPARTITSVVQPTGITLDMANNILFIASITSLDIKVFDSDSTVNGGAAPNRTITGASLSQPFGIQFIESLNRLYVANYHATTGRILYYNNARTLSGSPVPSVQSGNLTGPVDIFVDITR